MPKAPEKPACFNSSSILAARFTSLLPKTPLISAATVSLIETGFAADPQLPPVHTASDLLKISCPLGYPRRAQFRAEGNMSPNLKNFWPSKTPRGNKTSAASPLHIFVPNAMRESQQGGGTPQ